MAEAREHVVRLDEADAEFSEAVAKAGGEKINVCFQCGTCVASCPVNRFEETYNPRLILRMAMLGLKKRVLPSDTIWLCAACYSCTQRCPRGVRPTEVIRAIRNLAVKRGYIPRFFKTLGSAIVNFGRIYEEEEFVNEMRADLELPPVPPVNLEEVTKVLEYTKIRKLLTAEKGENTS